MIELDHTSTMQKFIDLGIDLASRIKEILHRLVRHDLVEILNPIENRKDQTQEKAHHRTQVKENP